MDFIPCAVQALAGDGYTVYAYLNDGTVRLVDVSGLINKGGVFAQISDPATFKETLTIMNGTVAWDVTGTRDPSTCLDIDPFSIYERAPVVRDPLIEPAT